MISLVEKGLIMIKVNNVKVTQEDIDLAVEASKSIKDSLETQISLGLEIDDYKKKMLESRSGNPSFRIFRDIVKGIFGIEIFPEPKVPENLQKDLFEQKQRFDKALHSVLSTIKKMEYVEYVQLGKPQTNPMDIAKKYEINDPVKFGEIISNEYETSYRKAMDINEMELNVSDSLKDMTILNYDDEIISPASDLSEDIEEFFNKDYEDKYISSNADMYYDNLYDDELDR